MPTTLCDPADPSLGEQLADAFAGLIGKRVRLVLMTSDGELTYAGHVPPRRDWLAADEPCLMVPPGSTSGPHVLAAMALSILTHDGRLVLARRRWYEDAPLDFQSLGEGAIRIRLEPVPDG
jgi:hypothetical protein